MRKRNPITSITRFLRRITTGRPVWVLLLLLGALPGKGQTNAFADQYLLNPFLLNPAIAGTGQYGTLSLTTRQQWSGWNDAPASQSVTFHTRWMKAKDWFNPLGFVNKGKNSFSKVGIGGGFFHESYGVFHQTGIHLDYSYHVFLGKGRVSFGLSPTLFQLGTSSIVLADQNDPYLADPVRSFFLDFNAGVHYFSKTEYAGLSLVQLANSAIKFGNYGFPENEDPSLNPGLARSVYAYGGKYFMLDRSLRLQLEPMAMVKLNAREGFRFDAGAFVHLRDQFQAGIIYSHQRGMMLSAGVILDNLSFRYIFEAPFFADIPNRYTTHQIQIAINIGQPLD
jgi:type IX secretion system PorP/SprF family membrane protein